MIGTETTKHFDRIKDFKGRRRNPVRFNVRPRYTPGSPAQVSEKTARMVAHQEQTLGGYPAYIEGIYGEENKAKAQREGLAGIVEARIETRKGWDVLDLITGERFLRPFER